MLSAHVPEWPRCQSVFWENDAALARMKVVQNLHLRPEPSLLSNSCQADLQPPAEVNHCMVGDKLVRLFLVLLDKADYSLIRVIGGSTAVTLQSQPVLSCMHLLIKNKIQFAYLFGQQVGVKVSCELTSGRCGKGGTYLFS